MTHSLHEDQIKGISDTLSLALDGLDPKSLGLDIRLHVTTSIEDTDGDTASADGDVEKEGWRTGKVNLLALPFVQLLQGRPDVDQIVSSEVQAATGAMSVNGALSLLNLMKLNSLLLDPSLRNPGSGAACTKGTSRFD